MKSPVNIGKSVFESYQFVSCKYVDDVLHKVRDGIWYEPNPSDEAGSYPMIVMETQFSETYISLLTYFSSAVS